MNDQNQNKQKQRQEETPKNNLGGASAANSSSGLKKLFAKRWVSPAIFMAAAAIIVTLMWIYQGNDPAKPTTGPDTSTEVSQGEGEQAGTGEEEAAPVVASALGMKWPVAKKEELQEQTKFYDAKATATEREAALVQVGNTFSPHTGIDFVHPDGQPFDVLAALDGTISHIEPHPTNGHVVEINHGDGLVTVYQSLTDVTVKEGDDVKQGTTIAKAGRSELEKDLGVHLHFETRLNGETVNPIDYIKE
ncbi:M23 family metallopeptidase [Paenibacillus sp. GSMTC-2017]|uniref:M23 family metallopeptidase n=1 Tax=Paenibacillus sp. GSMTC-2017 TaxID=2794350 RepID=UPI0018D69BDB|nr:M23 family metallopeptidase [Paenibacillus sp. GSMTC-2017]MBH5320585.1 M23 family metallopeptidase [Paenibacillus sp. GSMTC-2017]